MRVEAKILYPVLKQIEDGFYAWLDPNEDGYATLSEFKRRFRTPELKYENTTGLHTTLIYHTGPLPDDPVLPEDPVQLSALGTNVECWEDHKGRSILVLRLYSPDIEKLHNQLVSQGFSHSFPDYNAHVTLGKFEEFNPDIVRDMNAYLDAKPMVVEFQPKIYADSIN